MTTVNERCHPRIGHPTRRGGGVPGNLPGSRARGGTGFSRVGTRHGPGSTHGCADRCTPTAIVNPSPPRLTATIPSGRLHGMCLSATGSRLVTVSAVVAGAHSPPRSSRPKHGRPRLPWRSPPIERSGQDIRSCCPQRRPPGQRLLGPAERAILLAGGAEAVVKALDMNTDAAWASLGNRSVFARGVPHPDTPHRRSARRQPDGGHRTNRAAWRRPRFPRLPFRRSPPHACL